MTWKAEKKIFIGGSTTKREKREEKNKNFGSSF